MGSLLVDLVGCARICAPFVPGAQFNARLHRGWGDSHSSLELGQGLVGAAPHLIGLPQIDVILWVDGRHGDSLPKGFLSCSLVSLSLIQYAQGRIAVILAWRYRNTLPVCSLRRPDIVLRSVPIAQVNVCLN